MIKTRRLQFIGGQFLLNIPKRFIRECGLKKGDYFNIAVEDKQTLSVRKVADGNLSRSEALLPGFEQEIANIDYMLRYHSETIGPAEFCWQLGALSKSYSKLRKCRQRILRTNPPNNTPPAQKQ